MPKYYVKMVQTITVAIEAPSEDAVSDFLSRHTPDQVVTIVAQSERGGEVHEEFADEIQRKLPQDAEVAIKINERGCVI